LDLRALKAPTQWVRDSNNSPPKRPQVVRPRRMKSLRPSSFWLQTMLVSFTAQNSLSMEDALLFENIAGDTRRKPINVNLGIECHKQRIEPFSEGGMRKDTFF